MKHLVKHSLFIVITGIVITVLSCENTNSIPLVEENSDSLEVDSLIDETMPEMKEIIVPEELKGTDTTIVLNYSFEQQKYPVHILIRYPEKQVRGTILALHGWNLPYTDWCEKTCLCDSALNKGYIVILPDMGKSSYTFEIYPETRKDWAVFPTVSWLMDTAFTYIQDHFHLLEPGQKSFVLGLSTGGRGSALLGLICPDLFNACATLSGDFDQTQLKSDPIYNGFYGKYDHFPERWEGKDNMVMRAAEYTIPVYIGHGLLDKVCPVEQSIMFYDTLQVKNPELKTVLHVDSAAIHDYKFWNSEVNNMLNFFENSDK